MSSALTRDPIWWVVSYPKSGNTWVRMLLSSYALKTNLSQHFTRFDDLNPYFYQALSPAPLEELGPAVHAQIRPAVMAHLRAFEEGPIMVKSHHMHGSIQGVPLFSPAWTDRVVYIVRDPRAVLPSLADHLGYGLKEAADHMDTPMAGVEKEPGLHHILGSWSEHVGSWTRKMEETDRVQLVQYEDLNRNTGETLAGILEFLGIPVDPEAVEYAVDRTGFDRLRDVEEKRGWSEASSNQDRFFRNGEVDSWKDEVPPHLVKRIMDDHGAQMQKMGYLGPPSPTDADPNRLVASG